MSTRFVQHKKNPPYRAHIVQPKCPTKKNGRYILPSKCKRINQKQQCTAKTTQKTQAHQKQNWEKVVWPTVDLQSSAQLLCSSHLTEFTFSSGTTIKKELNAFSPSPLQAARILHNSIVYLLKHFLFHPDNSLSFVLQPTPSHTCDQVTIDQSVNYRKLYMANK